MGAEHLQIHCVVENIFSFACCPNFEKEQGNQLGQIEETSFLQTIA